MEIFYTWTLLCPQPNFLWVFVLDCVVNKKQTRWLKAKIPNGHVGSQPDSKSSDLENQTSL